MYERLAYSFRQVIHTLSPNSFTHVNARKKFPRQWKSSIISKNVHVISTATSERVKRLKVYKGIFVYNILRSYLVRPKDALEPGKQDGVVYKIPCECGKVYIGETGRAMQDRIKEHDRDIRLAYKQTSAVSEHANETGHIPLWNQGKFIDRDPHRYTRRVKEAIQIRDRQ